MKSREDLKTLLSPHPEGEGVTLREGSSHQDSFSGTIHQQVFTEKDYRGIGKNVMTHADALKGYHAYDEAIKLFVIEKVLIPLSSP